MEIPEFNILRDDASQGVRIWFNLKHGSDLDPILPAVNDHMHQLFFGESMTHDMLDNMRISLSNFLYDLCSQNYLFKFPNKRWRVNIVEYVANKLSYTVRYGRLAETYTARGPTNKEMLTQCLVNNKGELYDQVKMQPAQIIDWFAEELDQPELYEAIEKLKNEMIIDIANIK